MIYKKKNRDGFYGGLSVVPEEPILKNFRSIKSIYQIIISATIVNQAQKDALIPK